jgi:DNA replication protein DnaC
MITDNQIMNALTKLYDKKRMDAENKAYEINAFLQKDEAWQNNRYKIKNLRMEISRAKFDENFDKLPHLEQELSVLLNERALILKAKGLTESMLKVNYSCPTCSDTGYLEGGGLCKCFFNNLKEVSEQILSFKTPDLPTFDDFLETEESVKKLKALLMDYTDKFPPEKIKNLIFTGNPGTGKSFSAGCIANALISKNYSVIYLSAVKLNDVFLRYHTAAIGDKQAIFSLLTSCDMLIIDDLGTEPLLRNVTVEYLTATLSERLSLKAPFIITTNLDLNEIKTRYTERFSSRIMGSETARISFSGKDLRIKK